MKRGTLQTSPTSTVLGRGTVVASQHTIPYEEATRDFRRLLPCSLCASPRRCSPSSSRALDRLYPPLRDRLAKPAPHNSVGYQVTSFALVVKASRLLVLDLGTF